MMTTKTEGTLIYDALLSVPWMNEHVKVDLKISRKQILLLSQVILEGIQATDGMLSELLAILPKESSSELKQQVVEFLQKAGLSELEGKLKTLEAGK
ncbi:hypothetical protein [Pedobacter sp. V48]|uniref:hypothetical protein n=1 Tax=Pedobacter sp. V48 TaxID=509635 RepID=UPI0006647B0D|nr:hypothetical protein [Pedobacter sp. V48]